MRYFAAIIATTATLMSAPAFADGMRVHDLTTIETSARTALGKDAISRAEPERLTLTCPTCAGAPMVDLLLGRQTDGTEERVRSGATTVAQLEAQCQAREPSCQMKRADVGRAVGWVSSYKVGGSAGGTLILIAGGDMLTARVMAADEAAVRGTISRLKAKVLPAIVGR